MKNYHVKLKTKLGDLRRVGFQLFPELTGLLMYACDDFEITFDTKQNLIIDCDPDNQEKCQQFLDKLVEKDLIEVVE